MIGFSPLGLQAVSQALKAKAGEDNTLNLGSMSKNTYIIIGLSLVVAIVLLLTLKK